MEKAFYKITLLLSLFSRTETFFLIKLLAFKKNLIIIQVCFMLTEFAPILFSFSHQKATAQVQILNNF